MKALFATAVLAALLTVASTPPASAQQAAPVDISRHYANAGVYKIAVVDITYIFKEHARFKQEAEAMQARMQAKEQEFGEEQKAIALKEQQLADYKPNSDDFKRLDAEIIQMKANFGIKADRARKALMEEEADLYYKTYAEVQSVIASFAKSHDIGLVLRFSGDGIDPALRGEIIRGINRPVVFQNSIDITPWVLQMVNRGQTQPTTPPQSHASGISSRGSTIPPRQ